jgi:uncharacterized membrane protein
MTANFTKKQRILFVIITILLILFIFKMKNELKKASNTKEESPKRKN